MIAYKGFQKDLKCRGFQFQEYGINETEKANCRQNGFHCEKTHWIVSVIIRIGKIPCIT